MSILDSVLSVISGGATGLIGTAIQSVYQFKSKQLDIELEKSKFANELEQRKLDIQLQAQEAASAIKVAEITTEGEVAKADAATLTASYQLEPQQYSEKSLLTHAQNWLFVIVDTWKGAIRPGMTTYLCVLVSLIYFQTRGLIPTDKEGSFVLLTRLVDTILYVFTTISLWWFGSRMREKLAGK